MALLIVELLWGASSLFEIIGTGIDVIFILNFALEFPESLHGCPGGEPESPGFWLRPSADAAGSEAAEVADSAQLVALREEIGALREEMRALLERRSEGGPQASLKKATTVRGSKNSV